MARKRPVYTCTVTYTEGYERRLTEAMVDIYYNRLKGIGQEDRRDQEEKKEGAATA